MWHKAAIESVEKYILISWFGAFLEVRALESAYVNASSLSIELGSRRLHYFVAAVLVYWSGIYTNIVFCTELCKFLQDM